MPGPSARTLYCRPEGSVITPGFDLFSARNATPASAPLGSEDMPADVARVAC